MMRSVIAVALALGGFFLGAAIPDPVSPDPNSPRPIEAVDSVFIEELTWMEIRDAKRAGKSTVIVATGGIEQNGPYLATGKHNYVLRATTEAIARKLGTAFVAPIVPFVPEGDFDPPTQHMRYPGAISLTEETYRRLLVDIVTSFKVEGFDHVVLLGDSGGNQAGMQAVAEELTRRWGTAGTRVHFVPEYYDYSGVAGWLESHGIRQTPQGLHDDFAITAQMMAVDPRTVRMDQRIAAGNFSINGIELAPAEKTIEWGRKIIEFRAETTAKRIRELLARSK